MRFAFFLFIVFSFLHQHFACCCGTPLHAACNVKHGCTHEGKSTPTCQHRHEHGHDTVHCHHHPGEADDSVGDTGHEDDQSDDERAPHDHHYCVGSHLFYVGSEDTSLDFFQQLNVLAIICQPQDLLVFQPDLNIAAFTPVPDDPLSAGKLRAQLCVYRI